WSVTAHSSALHIEVDRRLAVGFEDEQPFRSEPYTGVSADADHPGQLTQTSPGQRLWSRPGDVVEAETVHNLLVGRPPDSWASVARASTPWSNGARSTTSASAACASAWPASNAAWRLHQPVGQPLSSMSAWAVLALASGDAPS